MKDPIPSRRSSKNFHSVLRNIRNAIIRIERVKDPDCNVFHNKEGIHSDEHKFLRLLDSKHLPKSNCDEIDEEFYIIYDRFCTCCKEYLRRENYTEENNNKLESIFKNIEKYYKYENSGDKDKIVEMLFEFEHITDIEIVYYSNKNEWDRLVEKYVSNDLIVALGLSSN